MEAKKNPKIDFYRMSSLFFNIGLVVSLSLVYGVFQIEVSDAPINLTTNGTESNMEQIIDIPITVQPVPPPPKIQIQHIVEASNEDLVPEDIPVIDMEMQENASIAAVAFQEPTIETPEEEAIDKVFNIVEEQAEPVGGVKAFYSYVASQLENNYPNRAIRMNIEGVVYIQFIVEKNGELTNIEAVKGIGGGCDELAIEVLENAPNWHPGKQRGVPVRTRKMVPIRFILKVK